MFPSHNSVLSSMGAGDGGGRTDPCWFPSQPLIDIKTNMRQGKWLGHVRRSEGMIAGEVKPLEWNRRKRGNLEGEPQKPQQGW